MDYYNATLRKQFVHFVVSGRPQYGDVIVTEKGVAHSRRQFTLDDVESGQVSYRHDGTENAIDSMDVEVTFSRQALEGIDPQRFVVIII